MGLRQFLKVCFKILLVIDSKTREDFNDRRIDRIGIIHNHIPMIDLIAYKIPKVSRAMIRFVFSGWTIAIPAFVRSK